MLKTLVDYGSGEPLGRCPGCSEFKWKLTDVVVNNVRSPLGLFVGKTPVDAPVLICECAQHTITVREVSIELSPMVRGRLAPGLL